MIANREDIFKIIAILTGILGSFYVLSPFISVILLAAVVALALDPLVSKIRQSRWCGHYACLYVLTFGLFLLMTVPFFTVLSKFYEKIRSFALSGEEQKAALENFTQNWSQLVDHLNQFLSEWGLRKTFNVEAIFNDGAQQLFSALLHASTYGLTQIPTVLFSFAVFLATLFLFMRHAMWMGRVFYSTHLMDPLDTKLIVKVLKETSYSAVFSSIITGLLQASIVTTGAAFFMELDNLLVFIVTFFCSFIPVIGAAPIAFVLAIYAWAKVSTGATIGMVVVGSIAGIADNVIRVFLLKIVKDKLHPFWALLAIIGGIIVLGLPGLFLGPVIVSATLQIVPALLDNNKRDRSLYE